MPAFGQTLVMRNQSERAVNTHWWCVLFRGRFQLSTYHRRGRFFFCVSEFSCCNFVPSPATSTQVGMTQWNRKHVNLSP